MSGELFIVEDATRDDRFTDNPLVKGAPSICFYAGTPLMNEEGFALGSLCVIDQKPRVLSAEQKEALAALGRLVVKLIESRQISAQLADALKTTKTLSGLLPICSYCKSIRNDEGYWQLVEAFVGSHSSAEFTHGICPGCIQRHFPESLIGP
jgi:hypothetical protein